MASQSSPFIKKNINPQKPMRFIQSNIEEVFLLVIEKDFKGR